MDRICDIAYKLMLDILLQPLVNEVIEVREIRFNILTLEVAVGMYS